MKVCLYLRYSSNAQTEQSIEGQDRVCTAYCEQNGYEIVERYIDRAKSAFKNAGARIEFQRMMDEAESAEWDAIIVYKLDRFARNRTDSAIYKSRLRKMGKQLISATEPISSDPEGILLEAVLEGMAEFYSAELGQKVTRGLRESAMKSASTGGRVPYGYKIVDRHFELDPVTAPIAKEIFERYASGEREVSIRNNLNARGIPTSTGGKWVRTSLQKMLVNPKYKGDYHFMDITNEGTFPAIIDEATWDKVQRMKITHQHSRFKESTTLDYALKGFVICGHCGKALFGDLGTGHQGQTYGYYSCYNHRRKDGDCPLQSVPSELLEEKITDEVKRYFTDKNLRMVAKILCEYASKQNRETSNIEQLRESLAEAEKKQGNYYKAIEDGLYTDTLRKNILRIEKEISRLKKQINDLANQEILISEDMCYEFLKEFTGSRFDAKKILQTFVNRVIVSSVETDVWDVSVEYAFGKDTPWDQKGSERFSLVTQGGQTSSPILVGNGTILCRYILKKPAHGEQASFLKEDIDLTAFRRLKAVLPYHTFMILS